jgi:hypothetical protein
LKDLRRLLDVRPSTAFGRSTFDFGPSTFSFCGKKSIIPR